MLERFFQLGPIPANQLIGTYDPKLIVLSYLVAVLASYIALDFTGRLRDTSNTSTSSLFWLVGGSIAMGAGIWSMHFIGMLSFSMPNMVMHYEPFWTSVSLMVAIFISGFALSLLKIKSINVVVLAVGGVILGLGIAAMHYTGMEAMKDDMGIHYQPGLFLLSIIIAIVASEVALYLALKSNQAIQRVRVRLKMISAIVMGVAICGMHYTGMFAAVFTPIICTATAASIDPTVLSISIATVTFIILGIAFFASTYKESLNQQQIESARQLGMAEVSASVLHNVGNVLNSVAVSIDLISEKNAASKLSGLENLRQMINEHKDDLTDFIEKDSRGSKIPQFLNALADYWEVEKKLISSETASLVKNIQHIKDIISTQQSLNKISEMEQVILIDEVINESLLIIGLDNSQQNITIERKYAKIKPFMIDKVKLLQILVNVLRNAKEAVNASPKVTKEIIIKTVYLDKNRIVIHIIDNGVGVLAKDLKKVFIYGFTTKPNGHGFGLHSSALAVNGMGGQMHVHSDGPEMGATFTIELPAVNKEV